MKYFLASTPILFVALLVGTPARADVAPPETTPCVGKAVGDACVYGGVTGTCQNQSCSKLDYAHWDRDASSSPPTASYTCVMCIPGANTSSTTNTATNTTTTTATNTDGGAPPSKDDGSCSIGKHATAKRVAPWLLAGTFSLLFLFGRRRRQN